MSSPIPSAPGDDNPALRPKPAGAQPAGVVALSGLLKVQRRWLLGGSADSAAPARTSPATPGLLTRLPVHLEDSEWWNVPSDRLHLSTGPIGKARYESGDLRQDQQRPGW